MKKIIMLIFMCFVFFMACAGNKCEIIENSDLVNNNEAEIANNYGSADNFKILKETLKARYLDIYNFGNGKNMNIEYEITKDYIYSEDDELADTEYTSKGTVYYYDKFIGSEDSNIIEERPVTEEDDKIYEWHNTQYYLEKFDSILDSLKDPGNIVEPQGEVTLDDEGRVIEDEVTYDDYVVVFTYIYDEKGRLKEKTLGSGDFGSTLYFTYDDQDRVIKKVWGAGIYGHSEVYYKYDYRGLLVEIFEMSRDDTCDGMDYTVTFEYIEK